MVDHVRDAGRRGRVLRGSTLARRPLVGVRLLPPHGVHRLRRRHRGGDDRRRPALGSGLAARRLAARGVDADHKVLRRSPDGTVSVHADIAEHCGGLANDIVVDSDGHAYVGNFGFDLMAGDSPRAAVICHAARTARSTWRPRDLRFPNGAVITPDGSTLMVGETMGGQYSVLPRPGRRPVGPPGVGHGRGRRPRRLHARRRGLHLGRRRPGQPPGPGGRGPGRGRGDPRSQRPGRLRLHVGRAGRHHPAGLRRARLLRAQPRQRAKAILATTTVDVPHAGLP